MWVPVGCLVGCLVGGVGCLVGCDVVGCLVGCLVGCPVGGVGNLVGCGVGCGVVGCGVVGCGVGCGVGSLFRSLITSMLVRPDPMSISACVKLMKLGWLLSPISSSQRSYASWILCCVLNCPEARVEGRGCVTAYVKIPSLLSPTVPLVLVHVKLAAMAALSAT